MERRSARAIKISPASQNCDLSIRLKADYEEHWKDVAQTLKYNNPDKSIFAMKVAAGYSFVDQKW